MNPQQGARAAGQRRSARSLPATRPVVAVMSYNIQGYGALFSRRYIESVARVIRKARPDVVGLQEVHRGTWAARFADQVEALAELTGMEAVFGRSLLYRTGEYGNAVLTRGRVTSRQVHCLPGEAERRSLFHTRIELPGQPLDFYVTHLAAWGRLARSIRDRQARFIAELLEDTSNPFVLTGDFNAPLGAPELETLRSSDRLHLCGRPGETTHRFMRQRLDYIFANPAWRYLRSEVLRAGPSDHYPVVATLRLEDEAAAAPEVEEVEPMSAQAG